VHKLLVREIPETSFIGMGVAVASIIVMPVLFTMKYRTGIQLRSKSLIADSKETLACLFLSVALLIGLGLNYLFGFWQADPIVGLIVVVFLAREGYEILTDED
jgi:divalent metal cation (Fe/Co/Zn/Cd) transporter